MLKKTQVFISVKKGHSSFIFSAVHQNVYFENMVEQSKISFLIPMFLHIDIDCFIFKKCNYCQMYEN